MTRAEPRRLRPLDLARTTFLVGAGVSAEPPSSIPPAARLLDALGVWIAGESADRRERLDRLLAPPSERRPYLGPYATTRFELLLEWLSWFEPGVHDALAAVEHGGFANRYHLLLADATRQGARILTTNFDNRLEEAAEALGMHLEVGVVSDVKGAARIDSAHLVKLHGTFRRPGERRRAATRPVGTLSQIARFGIGFSSRGPVADALRRAIDGRDLVVAGYSAWDSFDVVPLLESTTPAQVLWHRWQPVGPLDVSSPSPTDALLAEAPGPDTDAVLLWALQRRLGRVDIATGPSRAFFDAAWPCSPPEELEREAAHLEAGPAACGFAPDQGLRTLREILASDEMTLAPEAQDAMVSVLEEPYGLDGNPSEPDAPPALADPADEFGTMRELVRANRCVEAAKEAVRLVRQTEERSDRRTYADPCIYMLQSLFWQALSGKRDSDAATISRMFRREARHYRQIWAMVEADYLEANLEIGRAIKRQGGRRAAARARARQLLEHVAHNALRIPRPAMLVDAVRLLLSLSSDVEERRRYRAVLRTWRARLPPSEERLLASVEIIRSHFDDDVPGPPLADLEELTGTAEQAPDLVAGPEYAAIGRAYVACYGTLEDLEEAVGELSKLEPVVPTSVSELQFEIGKLGGVLARRREAERG